MPASGNANKKRQGKAAVRRNNQKGKAKNNGSLQYEITQRGRLSLTDFASKTGSKPGDRFYLEKPRGNSKSWRLVPAE
jgi:hypothetical protein